MNLMRLYSMISEVQVRRGPIIKNFVVIKIYFLPIIVDCLNESKKETVSDSCTIDDE